MPKLWSATIEAHRRDVRDAILNATAALADELGLRVVTMSAIAEKAGIGRATLYKYFPDVDAVLVAWHECQIAQHLDYLADVRDRAGDVGERLRAVLEAYAVIARGSHGHYDAELVRFLHRNERIAGAQQRLHALVRAIVAEGAESGEFRDDVVPDELATYCLHALAAASSLPSKAAVRRLVCVTLDGLRRA